MAEFDYSTRREITKRREEELNRRIQKISGQEKELAQELAGSSGANGKMAIRVSNELSRSGQKPSQWFLQKGVLPGMYPRKALLNAFVPEPYQKSFLYIIDKLNRFPFSRGWNRRTVRTVSEPQMKTALLLLKTYEKLFYCKEPLENYMYKRFDEEKLDYIKNNWSFNQNFSYIYAAEIDCGNQAVIEAMKDLILSENNTAYLDREMILGIIRSDNVELHKLLGDLLLAARLQEGLRQAICETMDEGCEEAFLTLLQVIEEHDLIRYSSVKRAVSTWIGIFDENHVDRVNAKLLNLMGTCLRNPVFCRQQLETNDSISISAALWALGFHEVRDAIDAMKKLVDCGTKNQKLTASFYNQCLFDDTLKKETARKVILEQSSDLELAASFMPAFTEHLSRDIRSLLESSAAFSPRKAARPKKPVVTDYFADRREAEDLYEKFSAILDNLPKKGLVFDPCIFPWYRVELSPSTVIRQMAFTAYVLQDQEKITAMARRLGDVAGGTYDRSCLINLLLYEPSNRSQQETLIEFMGNAEESTSTMAIQIVKTLKLEPEDYRLMEQMLRFKRSGLRNELLEFLMEQSDQAMEDCLKRLLNDQKEEKRSAGLDLLLRLSKNEEKQTFYGRVKVLAEAIQNPTDKEKVLIQEISGEERRPVSQKGFGIYNPDAPVSLPDVKREPELLKRWLPLPEKEIIGKLKKLDKLVEQYKDYEYESSNGDKQLFGNTYGRLKDHYNPINNGYCLENYPLEDVLRRFYEEEIGSYEIFMELEARLHYRNVDYSGTDTVFYKAVFGKMPFKPEPMALTYQRQIADIRLNYRFDFLDKKGLFDASVQAVQAITDVVDSKNKNIAYRYQGWNGTWYSSFTPLSNLNYIGRFFEGLGYWESDEEFEKAFSTAWRFELKTKADRKKSQFLPDVKGYNSRSAQPITPITVYWFLKAYHMNLISRDILYKAVLEYFNRKVVLEGITRIVKGEYSRPRNRWLWNQFFGNTMAKKIMEHGEAIVGKGTWCGDLIRELYDSIVPVMTDTELRRGEAETEFSEDIGGITYICGTSYLTRILMALGKDTLAREAYYSWYYSSSCAKRQVLSQMLKSCYPAEGENGETLRKLLKNTKIKADRLVEVAMFAPQWMDIIQEYLGWDGFKSGCYYFIAHMNERFDDQKKAIIARYTPLTPEELQDGAFDVEWFQEAYEKLGEKNFALLYKAAKYISDGLKHTRARKYADAATGKVTLEALGREITAKRNKDLLMSYGLVPFEDDRDRDLLRRYQFIQNYKKEARQFGAQRRASETKAAEIALVNLSVHAGFADVMRLTLNMETRLAEEFAAYMEWHTVDDTELSLHVDENGKSEILCRKNGKPLKSVPSRIGKNPYVLEVKEAHKKLKDQYVRSKKMMEESMESGDSFKISEIAALLSNPVVSAILKPLVFVSDEGLGFLLDETEGMALVSCSGEAVHVDGDTTVRIAHPLDFYKSGQWHEYQKYLFDHEICQPFKQVFRELYVKLPEELGLKASRMFAGNQIQPQKTVGCLKGRRWIADYEEGLQKIYYKENIVARIYALADWFSPSDIEAPALEWVEFSDRKTFQPLTIKDVPDLIYSEVMRDVDMAVSVAHAGGVDPETSHSTIEMRRAIVEFNLPLFGLKNVTLKDSHALIQGTRGSYTVHLGSGIIHQQGGSLLNILPVHSQKRGKLFLPFVDEDPKTAEIMSKIVLLAEDKKIKDPFILDQIR